MSVVTVLRNEYREGIRKPSPVASIIAAASGVNLWLLTTGRTAIIRKIHIQNNNAAASLVQIGTGLLGAFVAANQGWQALAGQELIITERELPNIEFSADITVAGSVGAAAPNNVTVQVEVEEFQGPIG